MTAHHYFRFLVIPGTALTVAALTLGTIAGAVPWRVTIATTTILAGVCAVVNAHLRRWDQ